MYLSDAPKLHVTLMHQLKQERSESVLSEGLLWRGGLSSIILRLSVFSRHTPFAVSGYVYTETNHN